MTTPYDSLKAEIALPAYNGLTDQQIVDAINANTVEAFVDVPIGNVYGYLLLQGVMMALRQFIASPPTGAIPQAVVVASAIVEIVQSPQIRVFKTSDQETYATISGMTDLLKAQGLMSDTQQAAVLSMAKQSTSRAAQLGFSIAVTVDDLAAARSM